MKKIIFSVIGVVMSASAMAAPSSCVTYVDSTTQPVVMQYSCDGAALQTLLTASGITAAISQTIPYFVGRGYSFSGCSEGYSPGDNVSRGYAYSRCFFVKQ